MIKSITSQKMLMMSKFKTLSDPASIVMDTKYVSVSANDNAPY